MSIIARRVLWAVGAALSLLVVLVASRYLARDPSTYFEEQRAVYVAHAAPLLLHVGGAMLALLVAPFQLTRWVRARPRLHRPLGRVFAVGVLAGGTGGLLLAPRAYGGVVSALGFTGLAVVWLSTTALGVAAVRRGDVATHRRWMIRAFAVTFAAVTLRLYLGLWTGLDGAGLALGEFVDAYRAIAWLCWVPNLALAWWLTSRSTSGSTSRSTQDQRAGSAAAHVGGAG